MTMEKVSVATRLLAGIVHLSCFGQYPVYYHDHVELAGKAMAQADLVAARQHYAAAFERRPALLKDAIAMARLCWTVGDSACTIRYVDKALDQGLTGEDIVQDSTLGRFWADPISSSNRARWQRYEAMRMPALQAELEAMFHADQAIRKSLDPDLVDSPDSTVRAAVWAPVNEIDRRHMLRACEIVRQHGVPGIHQVGLTGNKAIFFAFIHAPVPDTLHAYAEPLRKSVVAGASPAMWYAYIVDRIMVMTSKATMYGTTGLLDRSDGVTYFVPVDPDLVDLLRERVGLGRMNPYRAP